MHFSTKGRSRPLTAHTIKEVTMKRFISLVLTVSILGALSACSAPPVSTQPTGNASPGATSDVSSGNEFGFENDWRIGIITGTVSQGEEEYLSATNMANRYGPDRIITSTYPDNFTAEMEVTIANIQAMADAGAKAIIICQAVPGTIAAIQTTRERFGDDILFFAGVPQEPPTEIASYADVVMMADDLAMGKVIMEQAARLGADTFAHISFPRHLGMESISARRVLLMETAEELGIRWVELTAPDPTTEGVQQAQQFVIDNIPRWVNENGENTAFFSTNCALQEPMITQIASYGGLYPLQCCPSPYHALPAALNISMTGNEGDVLYLIDQIQEAFDDLGAGGRFSTWPVPINMLLVEVATLYSIEYLEGRTNGRHDEEVLRNLVQQVASSYSAEVEVNKWPLPDSQGDIENFYTLLADFITF
jgi:hypothetical protein